jgi:hypothetical protein
MNFRCPKCHWIHTLDPGDTRLPPWCPKCGVDLKPNDWRATPDAPPASSPPRVSRMFANVDHETQVTGTGGKPWLNPTKPEPTAEAVPPAETAPPPTEPDPAAEADPDAGLAAAAVVMKYVGIALLVVAPLLAAEVWTFAKNGQTVNGRVAVVWKPEPLKFALYRAERVIEYEVNGAKYELPAGNREEGEWVELMYPPADPQDARIAQSPYQWPIILVGAGFMLLASAWVAGSAAAEVRKPKTAPTDPTG